MSRCLFLAFVLCSCIADPDPDPWVQPEEIVMACASADPGAACVVSGRLGRCVGGACCTGCVTELGICRAGNRMTACGISGEACAVCTGVMGACEQGDCVITCDDANPCPEGGCVTGVCEAVEPAETQIGTTW